MSKDKRATTKGTGMKKYILKNTGVLTATLLFGSIFSIGSTLIALILKEVIDVAIQGDLNRFFILVQLTIAYLAVAGVCYWLYSRFSKKFICQVTRMLCTDVFNGIFRKNVSDFNASNSADYLSALTNDVKNVEENYLNPLLLCLLNIVVFITSFVVMLYIRSYKMNEYAMDAFGEKNSSVYHSKYALDKVLSTVEALSTILSVTVQCSVLFISAYLIITGKITAGALVGLVQVAGTIVVPIQVLSQNIPRIKGTQPIIDRLNGFSDYHDRHLQELQFQPFIPTLPLRTCVLVTQRTKM